MKARTLFPTQGVRQSDDGKVTLVNHPPDTIIDHPDAWQLVSAGVAAPADDECAARCGLTAEQIADRARHYDALNQGILPEHRELFFAGKITGYDQETGEFLVTEQFTVEDAAKFPNETPAELFTNEEDDETED